MRWARDFEETFVEVDGFVAACDGFQVLANGTGTARTTVFLDEGQQAPPSLLVATLCNALQ